LPASYPAGSKPSWNSRRGFIFDGHPRCRAGELNRSREVEDTRLKPGDSRSRLASSCYLSRRAIEYGIYESKAGLHSPWSGQFQARVIQTSGLRGFQPFLQFSIPAEGVHNRTSPPRPYPRSRAMPLLFRSARTRSDRNSARMVLRTLLRRLSRIEDSILGYCAWRQMSRSGRRMLPAGQKASRAHTAAPRFHAARLQRGALLRKRSPWTLGL
jgi:hypothetical protein